MNVVYSSDTVTANYVQFWFRRFRSRIFDVKDAPHTGRSIVKNVDKIAEIIKADRHVSSPIIAQELKINHKTVCFKPVAQTRAKRNEINPFLKRMVTGDTKWVTYDNIVRKRKWSKCGEAAQKVARPGLIARKVLLCIWGNWKGII
ncbi:putative DD34D transposase [Trichonephila clavipes]|nr:putative DD34D transposase [Trichonephila clavipes]